MGKLIAQHYFKDMNGLVHFGGDLNIVQVALNGFQITERRCLVLTILYLKTSVFLCPRHDAEVTSFFNPIRSFLSYQNQEIFSN